MTNKIIGIQGDKLDKINISSDTSIFLAHEAQKLGYKIFYYTPSNLSIIKNKTYANGVFVKFNYESKKFYKIYKRQKINVENLKRRKTKTWVIQPRQQKNKISKYWLG